MLSEQGVPAAGSNASDAEQFATVLRAVGAGGLGIGEFYGFLMSRVPAWDRQDELQRCLLVLLDSWESETTPDGRAAVAAAVRRAARDAVSECG
jgi:DNA-binding transcriptional LysR family regulator